MTSSTPIQVRAGPGIHPFWSDRWSDVWRAPAHDFPLRDEILHQFLACGAQDLVLEVGPGCGSTAFRLARVVRELVLVDASPAAVADLDAQLAPLPNVHCYCADLSLPESLSFLRTRGDFVPFDTIFGLDVFEYVQDPETCIQNLMEVLRPGGHLLLSFPNAPPPQGDGVTWFLRRQDLERLFERAGFQTCRLSALRLRPLARTCMSAFHDWPLSLLRRLRGPLRQAPPQTYEATWAFQHRRQFARLKIPIHLCWLALGLALRCGGSYFDEEPDPDEILGKQLLVRAWR